MASNKSNGAVFSNTLTASGLNGKSITGMNIFRHGMTVVVELLFSGGSQFIKIRQTRIEFGGDHDFGSGIEIAS